MKKFIITESEKNTIRQMYGLNEQVTPPVTSGTTPTQTTLTPAEQKKQEYLKKREEQKKANAARLAPIEAAQKKRIDDWIADNPGKTEKDYWKMIEKRQSGPDVPLDGLQDPSFTSTNCGISKQHAKDDKKEWKSK
jgi:hypothetical protein